MKVNYIIIAIVFLVISCSGYSYTQRNDSIEIAVEYAPDSIKISTNYWAEPFMIRSLYEFEKGLISDTPIYCVDASKRFLYLFNPSISLMKIDLQLKKVVREEFIEDIGSFERRYNLNIQDDRLLFSSIKRFSVYDLDLNLKGRLVDSVYNKNHDLVNEVGRHEYELKGDTVLIRTILFTDEIREFIFNLKDY